MRSSVGILVSMQRLHHGVNTSVLRQSRAGREALATVVAAERRLSRVASAVLVEVGRRREVLAALFATVRLLARMRPTTQYHVRPRLYQTFF